MHTATRFNTWAVIAASALGAASIAQSSHAQAIPLPTADQKALDQYLGKGVVGEAVEGDSIADPSKFYPLRAATLSYRVTSGKDNGGTETHVWTQVNGNWRESWGKDGLTVHLDDDGSIYMLIHEEGHESVINKYSPHEPMVLKGMKPGETRKSKSDVKVFDADKPDKLSHEGSLNLALTYVGAYRVTVPAGSYDAILLKSQYTGKIGPAKVNDLQYRLLAAGIGTVAEIEKKKVSALMVYNDETKTGKVLLAAPEGAPAGAAATAATEPINKRDRKARAVIAKFKAKDPTIEKFFTDSAGWAVFPTIAKGGLIVGGAQGDGVVYHNDEVIGYSTVSQGSIGLQIGGQTYSEIVFFQDKPALNHFKQGNAEFSAQASAVAVKSGASADAGYAEGVAIFTMAKGGAMLEASVGGQGFSFEEK